MNYRFEIQDVSAKKGKMSREERYDITKYITEQVMEADTGKKAFRLLAARVNGKLPKSVEDSENVITLPDYGGCQIRLRAVVCR
ncbi:MAG: hypothetical protein IJA58_01385 [Lachnospiraceae bacterium]|nr:hypothetical protein [Lachnospiraceae bacterium]